jgi:anionic cell wall polymer biosynthesis LytR-Cps2A-Psr (LCP) family protein
MPSKFSFSKQNIILGIILVVVFCLGFSITYFSLKLSKIFVKTSPDPSPTPIQNSVSFGETTDVVSEKGVYNTVLLGYGGAGHSGGLLTDSIIVVHVNTNKKTAALISIPRDLWVTGGRKINAEASINGFQNEGGVIKSVTGLPVDYFAAIDFQGFPKLIDKLGGISVTVPKTFDDPFYPIAGLENETCGKSAEEIATLKSKYSDYQLETQFTCRYEHLHFDQGPANLDGVTALKFVRSRHGDSDFGRSARQFAVLKGVLAKLISLNALSSTNKIIDGLVEMVKTNLSMSAVKDLIQIVGDTDVYKITDIHLTTENLLNEGKSSEGAYILVPKAGMFNFTEIKNFIAGSI